MRKYLEKLDGTAVSALQRTIAKAKQRSQKLVMGCETKIYDLVILRASERTLNR
jgi:hypothetical protein